MKRKAISKAVRFEIFKRDGFKCVYCGKQPPEVMRRRSTGTDMYMSGILRVHLDRLGINPDTLQPYSSEAKDAEGDL